MEAERNMREHEHVVAIIPARGGSKGIPGKNTQEIVGKPLIAYTIEAALQSRKIQRTIVSTDDEEIASIARSLGAEVPFIRPKELARADIPTLLVVQHAVKYLEGAGKHDVDVVVLLQPTSPLRDTNRIDEAVEKLLRTGADSVVTVCEVKHHPFWSFTVKGDRLYRFLESRTTITRRQDLPAIYALNGAVYVTRRNTLFEQNAIFGRDTRAIVMLPEESVDIDDYFDLFIAEMTLRYWREWLHEKSKNGK